MALQYLSDSTGKPTAVVIPIKEWELLKEKHQDLQLLENPVSVGKKRPSDFRGSITKEMAQELNQHVEQSRKEWDRNIS